MATGTFIITGVSGCGKTAMLRRLTNLLEAETALSLARWIKGV